MRVRFVIGFMFLVLLTVPGPALAAGQDPPANYGELAALIVEQWGLAVASNPTAGDPNINALNVLGIGLGAYETMFNLRSDDVVGVSAEVSPDGYDPYNWDYYQELTADFICQLKLSVWAAAYVGNIPAFGTPARNREIESLSQQELDISHEIACAAVANVVALAQRDFFCGVLPPPPEPTKIPIPDVFDAPTLLSPANGTVLQGGDIFLEWEAVQYAPDYTWQVKKNGVHYHSGVVTDTSFSGFLDPGTYTWQVMAGYGYWSAPWEITIQ